MRGLPLVLVITACSPGEDKDVFADDTQETDMLSDTELSLFEPGQVALLLVTFAYDPSSDTARSWTDDGLTLDPTMEVLLYASGWRGDLTDTANYCVATYTWSGRQGRAAWTEAEAQLFAADFGPVDTVDGDCDDIMEPRVGPDFMARIGDHGWGVGITERILPGYEAQLREESAPIDFDATIGAMLGGTLPPTELNWSPRGGLTTGRAVDDDFVATDVVLANGDMAELDTFSGTRTLGQGLYNISMSVPLELLEALAP